jgi:hypothetical protein
MINLKLRRGGRRLRILSWLFTLSFLLAIVSGCTAQIASPPIQSSTETGAQANPIKPPMSETKQGHANMPTSNSGPAISDITTNAADYPGLEIPRFEKFEVTFQVKTQAENPQFPFDPAPPPGLEPGQGVSVEALLTPDNWQTVFIQPAFLYQDFQAEEKEDRLWLYPTSNFSWKVRFSPHQAGAWQFKLRAEDRSGVFESSPFSFEVGSSDSKGFLRVSQTDPRYFEFDDGSYFPALGYNFDIPADEETFKTMSANGIQFIRTWLPSQLQIYGSAWSVWRSFNSAHNPQVPDARLRHNGLGSFGEGVVQPVALEQSEVALWLSHNEKFFEDGVQWDFNPCMVYGFDSFSTPVKPNTDYRVRVRYQAQALTGPRVDGQAHGFTVKLGGWLWDENDETQRCDYPGAGETVAASYGIDGRSASYPDPDHPGWQILEGHFNSGERNFLDLIYLTIENASAGNVFVDQVWLEEELADSQFGPNIFRNPRLASHQYFSQQGSYLFDQTLALAEKYDIYLKLVILEKQDYVLSMFEPDGSLSSIQPYENGYQLLYGNGREPEGKTKIRWLQEAYWRYLQARWGYSTSIHSWELLNEGDPTSTAHYILTDEMGKYFRTAFIPDGQATLHPNRHLVTTSFWHSFPLHFWSSSEYAYVDYADIHSYASPEGAPPLDYLYSADDFYDTALFSQKFSIVHGAKQPEGPGKPVVRGEVGFFFNGPDFFTDNTAQGLWLHNMIWAGINPGGLIELQWTAGDWLKRFYQPHEYDHRPMFKAYYNFIHDIPLNNGYYQDAEASSLTPDLRVWGQKDITNGRAHLWLQNKQHTWNALVNNTPLDALSDTISISGFAPGQIYTLERWDTTEPNPDRQVIATETVTAQADGSIDFSVENLTTDLAVKILP